MNTSTQLNGVEITGVNRCGCNEKPWGKMTGGMEGVLCGTKYFTITPEGKPLYVLSSTYLLKWTIPINNLSVYGIDGKYWGRINEKKKRGEHKVYHITCDNGNKRKISLSDFGIIWRF